MGEPDLHQDDQKVERKRCYNRVGHQCFQTARQEQDSGFQNIGLFLLNRFL